MGPACEYPCVHGVEDPPFSTSCTCDPCYSDSGCETMCSNVGQCINKTCICDEGFTGDHCEKLDCPGKVYTIIYPFLFIFCIKFSTFKFYIFTRRKKMCPFLKTYVKENSITNTKR